MENKMITYTPNPEAPINLDLSSYSRPEADRGTVKFAWMYAVFGAVCVILLILKQYLGFVQSYFVLLEVMAAILLFMAGKCYFAYAREYSRFLRWDCTAARIKKLRSMRTMDTHSLKWNSRLTVNAKAFSLRKRSTLRFWE